MKKVKKIKCVVWDLDNTLWDGVLLEGSCTGLKKDIIKVIKELDSRGILHSIASKNEYHTALAKLEELKIVEYFIYPQVSWNQKSDSIKEIASMINIHYNSIAFIDDKAFERDEVSTALSDVVCFDAADAHKLLDMPIFQPLHITNDSKNRRKLYQDSIKRKDAETKFSGTREEFLKKLGMTLTISPAQEGDLERAEELTVRTNQLNSTAITYSSQELEAYRKSDEYLLYTAELKDKYGSHSKIGLILIECKEKIWMIKLLLVSCRVISYGIGTVLLCFAINRAKRTGVELFADFRSTDRNRIMYVTFKLAGFYEVEQKGKYMLLKNNLQKVQAYPYYIDLQII